MKSPAALVAEPSPAAAGSLTRFLEAEGFYVESARYLDEAAQKLQGQAFDVCFAAASGSFDGETLCQAVKRQKLDVAMVLVFPSDEVDPATRAATAGAQAYLVGPLKKSQVGAVGHAMLKVRQLTGRVQFLEAELSRAVDDRSQMVLPLAGVPLPRPSAPTPQQDGQFMTRYLAIELKRAQRYRFPVSLILVGGERVTSSANPAATAEPDPAADSVRVKLQALLRDVDVIAPHTDGAWLLYLPNTAKAGALTVAQRVLEEFRGASNGVWERVSVGLAGYEPPAKEKGKPPDTLGLLREATEAQRRAREAGGNRVEVAKSPVSKREREPRQS